MKLLIDVEALIDKGVITSDQASLLKAHGVRITGGGALNLLLAFGAVLVALGISGFFLNKWVVLILGLGLIFAGYVIAYHGILVYRQMGRILMVTGALMASGTLIFILKDFYWASFYAWLLTALILASVSIKAQSHFLMTLVPFALEAALGGSTGYWDACYSITIREPTVTICVFSPLSYGAWQGHKTGRGIIQNLALTFARVCVLLVNFAFWVGSLWGDAPVQIWQMKDISWQTWKMLEHLPFPFHIQSLVFVIAWAVVLALAGYWGMRRGRQFMVNTVAVFASIHFYTQWFQYIGAYPLSIALVGFCTILLGLLMWQYNKAALVE